MRPTVFFIGIDVGGTFTDVVVTDDHGSVRMYKTPTVPGTITQGVVEGVQLAATDYGLPVDEFLNRVGYFGHGTTVSTNALLERKGVKTGLITTMGFGDTMLIARAAAATVGLSNEQLTHYRNRREPNHVVPPDLIKEVSERIDSKGQVVVPLNELEVRQAVRELVAEGVKALAISTLWSFLDPRHEQRIKQLALEEAPDLYITASSDLVPMIKEYERTATTVLNSYLGPEVANYMGRLEGALQELGLRCRILVMNPVGGVLPAPEAAHRSVSLLNSGPAAGVVGSIFLGKFLGYDNIVATDMGGTSFDASLIVDGQSCLARHTIADVYHILTPTIDIRSIGAGGGSIAHVNNRFIKVGPRSAGASPGPVCYDRGGTEPTVTDADVALGIINPDNFLGGRMRLNKEKAIAAIKEKVADPLGMDVLTAAAGIRRIVDNHMADLLREILLEKGHDPRDFVIFAFGGAGGTHCGSYGAELGARSIVVPYTSMVHCAFGCVASDIKYTFEVSLSMRTPSYFDVASKHLDFERINAIFADLREKGDNALQRADVPAAKRSFHRSAKMRYCRQTLEVSVPMLGGTLTPKDIDDAVARFEAIYEDRFGKGSAYREAGVEISTFCIDAIGHTAKPRLKEYEVGPKNAEEAITGHRQVYFAQANGLLDTAVYDYGRLRAGHEIPGPAIVEYPGTTVLVEPVQKAGVDRFLNISIETN